jgi:hypothetical protein
MPRPDTLRGLGDSQGSFNTKVYEEWRKLCAGKETRWKLARLNRHLTIAQLLRIFDAKGPHDFPEADIPVYHQFAPAKENAYYGQWRLQGRKRYMHHVFAATRGLELFDRLSDPQASHRNFAIGTAAERNFNPNGLHLEEGEVNRSRLFCRLLYFKVLSELTGMDSVITPFNILLRTGGLLRNDPDDTAAEEAEVEALEELVTEHQDMVTLAQHNEAMARVHQACVQVHGDTTRCLCYFPGSADAKITSLIAKREAIQVDYENWDWVPERWGFDIQLLDIGAP